MKKVLPEFVQSWLNRFPPRILFPHHINDFSLFLVILRQVQTYQADRSSYTTTCCEALL